MTTRTAKQTIEQFWRIQDEGDAILVDPFFGTFNGKEAIAGFMAKMNEEMKTRETEFLVREIAGAGDTAWAQWVAKTPAGDIEGCGLYKVREGLMTYYKDYMNVPES